MELLESRCVLSGFGMPPMMGVHSDFGHEIDGDRFEESRFEPDFGGGRGRPDFHHPAGVEFGPPSHGFPEPPPDFGGRPSGAPQLELFPFTKPSVPSVATQLSPRPSGETNPPSIIPEFVPVSRGTQPVFSSPASLSEPTASGLSPGATDLNALAATGLVKTSVAASTPTFETPSLRSGEGGSHREETAVPKQQSKEALAGQVKSGLADGLIELPADNISQRFKRKLAKPAVDLESSDEGLQDSRTLAFLVDSADANATRLPLLQESADRELASWPAQGPAWSPENEGLVEILAANMVSTSHQPTRAEWISGKASDSARLEAKVEIHQAFELATDPRIESSASMAQLPHVSLGPREPARDEQTE